MTARALALLLLASCATSPAGAASRELILCGAAEVFIVDLADLAGPRKVWSWTAKDRADLPEALRSRFGSTDECKPVDGGSKILITSSGGGVALVERPTGKVWFHAHAVNAHSAELLPGNRVVVASSYGTGGNALLLFDLGVSGKPLATEDFHGAHGAVWDSKSNLLWALGDSELRVYRVTPDPSLVLSQKFPLPDQGGHDLRPLPHTRDLIVTTNKAVWLFDREALRFRPHPALAENPGVKGVDVHPGDGRVAYIQAETRYWAERVRLLPSGEVLLPGEKLYKARWIATSEPGSSRF